MVRSGFVLLLGLAVLVAIPALAAAAVYTTPHADLLDTANYVAQQGTLNSRSTVGSWTRFNWAWSGSTLQIGDGFDLPANNSGIGISSLVGGNLSGSTGYDLLFHNPNTTPIHVNTFLNTGWTDVGYGETDHFYQNGWTFLNAGETKLVSIDFSSADTYEGSTSKGLTAVQNLNHVTNIGYQVSIPGASDPFTWAKGTAGDYDVDVAPIPEPASILVWSLLGACGIGLTWWRRKR